MTSDFLSFLRENFMSFKQVNSEIITRNKLFKIIILLYKGKEY
jgi:hypothetical protein